MQNLFKKSRNSGQKGSGKPILTCWPVFFEIDSVGFIINTHHQRIHAIIIIRINLILIFAKKIHLMNPVSLGLDQRISSLLHWRGFAKPVWSHVKLFGERSPKSDKSTLIFHSSSKFTQLLEVIRPAQKYRIARAHWFVGSNVHLAGITSATSRASCAPLRTQVSKICFFQNQLCVESW